MAKKAVEIAKELLFLAKESGINLTNMQIQKLVYIAHGLHLAIQKEALLEEPVRAWKHGPVIPEVYRAYKQYLNSNIDLDKEAKDRPILTDAERESVKITFDNFSKFSGWQLREITHIKGSPWHKVWFDGNGNETYNAVIDDHIISEHYNKILKTQVVDAL